jgi:hypothetical protein
MTERQRRRRDQRSPEPTRMQLTERDISIVEAVHTHRVLSQKQIQLLIFGPKNVSGAKRRLRFLFDQGYLDRKFFPVQMDRLRSPTLYILDRKGAELLRLHRGYDELVWYSSSRQLKPTFLEHTLAINDVMVAVTLACSQPAYELETWVTENQIKADYDRVSITTSSGARRRVAVVPDSYFSILVANSRAPFFLELDRGTMTNKQFKDKIRAYLAYQKTRGLEKRFGIKNFRVLTVTVGEKRLENLKTATEEVRGGSRFWFSTLSQVSAATVLHAPIWAVATRQERQALFD